MQQAPPQPPDPSKTQIAEALDSVFAVMLGGCVSLASGVGPLVKYLIRLVLDFVLVAVTLRLLSYVRERIGQQPPALNWADPETVVMNTVAYVIPVASAIGLVVFVVSDLRRLYRELSHGVANSVVDSPTVRKDNGARVSPSASDGATGFATEPQTVRPGRVLPVHGESVRLPDDRDVQGGQDD